MSKGCKQHSYLVEDGKVFGNRPLHGKLRSVEHSDGLRFRIVCFRVALAHVLGGAARYIQRLVVGRVVGVCEEGGRSVL